MLLAAVLAFTVSALSLFIVRPMLRRLGAIDVPNERSSHSFPTLRGAGAGPLLGVLVGLLVIGSGVSPTEPVLSIVLAAIGLGGLGLVEDVIGLPIGFRALLQVAIAGVVCAVFVVSAGSSMWWIAVGAVVIAAYVNVTNFMDGINGISGLHGVIAGLGYAVIGVLVGSDAIVAVSVVLAAAFGAFLPWNVGRGRVFLGDAGSYLLGGVVSALAIWALLCGAPFLAVLGPVAIYLADTGSTLARRVLRGDRWYESHRSHVYQRLTDETLGHTAVAGIVTGFTAIAMGFGFLSVGGAAGTLAAAFGILATAAVYLSMPSMVAGTASRSALPRESSEQHAVAPGAACVRDAGLSLGSTRWAVVGASGFVGQSVCAFLRTAGVEPVELSAPRVSLAIDADSSQVLAAVRETTVSDWAQTEAFRNCEIVVNAAGMATPDGLASPELFGANALLPVLLAEAASMAGVSRLIHVSSAAVQGARATLDESPETEPFSPYSASKALGEEAIAAWRETSGSNIEVVVVRAASVQGSGRKTTQSLRRLARLPIASVASPGTQRTPVTSVESLAVFVAAVGAHEGPVPGIVLQPWEGMTTRSVLEAAGKRSPMMLPAWLCRFTVTVAYAVSRALGGRMRGAVRRIELMWFGQEQHAAWADSLHIEMPRHVATVLSGSHITGGLDEGS